MQELAAVSPSSRPGGGLAPPRPGKSNTRASSRGIPKCGSNPTRKSAVQVPGRSDGIEAESFRGDASTGRFALVESRLRGPGVPRSVSGSDALRHPKAATAESSRRRIRRRAASSEALASTARARRLAASGQSPQASVLESALGNPLAYQTIQRSRSGSEVSEVSDGSEVSGLSKVPETSFAACSMGGAGRRRKALAASRRSVAHGCGAR